MSKLTSVQKKALIKGGMKKVVAEIALAFATIIDSAEYLGHLVNLGREEWGSNFDKALREVGVMNVVVNACVKVADGKMDPRLVLCAESNARYHYLANHCDVVTQKRILDKGVQVLVCDKDGNLNDHLMVKLECMTDEQVKQCITSEGFRDLAAQRAWIESRRVQFKVNPTINKRKQSFETTEEYAERVTKIAEIEEKTKPDLKKEEPPAPPKPDWEIVDGKLVVNKPGMTFTQVELIKILGQLAGASEEVA